MTEITFKPKIIHILGDSEYGGGSKIVEAIISEAVANNFDVSILTTNSKMAIEANKLGARVVNLRCIKSTIAPLSDLLGILKLFIFLKKNKFDIVHTHTTKAGMIGRIAAALANVPIIIHTIHGFAFSESSSKLKVYFYSIIEKICAIPCTKIVTVSNYHRDWAIKLGIGSNDKLLAIPNGIKNKNNLISKSDLKIIFVGRMVREKGVEDLLSAFSLLITKKRLTSKCTLELFGDGPDRVLFENLTKSLSISDFVTFKGFVRQEKMIIQEGSIFVLPSYREGFSISLLEAMSLGLPIVATDIGGNKEALEGGECGLLYKAGNIKALAKNLETLINDTEVAENLSTNAKRIFRKKYKLESMASSYISLYKNLEERKC